MLADDNYDYLVVGAGSAGCVLAARLSERGASVLVVEAGPADSDPNIWIPSGWPATWGTVRDYGYSTIPQEHAAGRTLIWPRGKTLGGSSAINGMIYVRGNRTDFDAWSYEGCVGWDYDSVLPYFKKSENYEGGPSEYHGVGGLLNVAKLKNPNPVCSAAVQAAVEAGFPFNEDCNGADPLGVGFTDLTVKDDQRHSASAAFLRPALQRPNLKVLTEAFVTRLLFNGTRCVGVEYVLDDEICQVRAGSEVILSSGSIGSPHILMLSGIGDREELRQAGITPFHHLPGVGKNLQDHLLCSVIFESEREIPPPKNNFLESQLFWKSDSRRIGPDLQPLFMHLPYYPPGLEGPANAWTLCAGVVRPVSRGWIRPTSADPRRTPQLNPNILAAEADLRAMESAIRICLEIGRRDALSSWRKQELYPGKAANSQAALWDYIRQSAVTYHHQVGTCKMGIGGDAVVDPELRVHGLQNLRVVDASIMPNVTSGNTNAPTIMIAEKAADMILPER